LRQAASINKSPACLSSDSIHASIAVKVDDTAFQQKWQQGVNAAMDSLMMSNISAQIQIFLAVVCLDQIDMVDAFRLDEGSAHSSLHNFDMFPLAATTSRPDSVAVCAGPFSASGDSKESRSIGHPADFSSQSAGQVCQGHGSREFSQAVILRRSPVIARELSDAESVEPVMDGAARNSKVLSKV
jgi:hypothetical protein